MAGNAIEPTKQKTANGVPPDPELLLAQPYLSKAEFKFLRSWCICDRRAIPVNTQAFILRAVIRDDEVGRWYWLTEFEIESDMLKGLPKLKDLDPEEYENTLRHVRRFLLQRYAFGLARRVNRQLFEHLKNTSACRKWPRGEPIILSQLWLWKDLLLLRVGLALFIGYAILVGAGNATEWLKLAVSLPSIGYFIGAFLFVPIVLLVYLSVRNRIGNKDHCMLYRRTCGVLGGCLLWSLAGWGAQTLLCRALYHGDHWPLSAEWLIAEAALFVALLGQFFFGKSGSGSMSEPL